MIGHAVYLQHLMFVLLKNACDILMQPFFPFTANKGGPVFNCKYKMDVNLGITIHHGPIKINYLQCKFKHQS